MQNVEIVKEITSDKPFLIVNKPSGIPSAPLTLEDLNSENNIFSICAKLYPQLLQVHGRKEIEHGLIHRIDTVTKGLVIIAGTQDCYDELIKLQLEGKIRKYYSATCELNPDNGKLLEGFPKKKFDISEGKLELESYFRPYGIGRKEVRPVTEECGESALKKVEKKVLYRTDVSITDQQNDFVKIEASIINGYRHQVRCHLAWAGIPVCGDELYNYNARNKINSSSLFDFTASKIDISGEIWYI